MNLATLIWFVVYALGAGFIISLLWYLILYVESQFPGPGPFWKLLKCAFVVMVVVVLCFWILSLMTGQQFIRWQ